MTGLLRLVMVGFAIVAILLFYGAGSAWRKRNHVSSVVTLLTGALLLTLSGLCAAITVGIRGYRAFTAEQLAATIKTEQVDTHKLRTTDTRKDSIKHTSDMA